MKKIIIIMLFATIFLTGGAKEQTKQVDYSEYLFTNKNWTRDSGYDIETIKFKSDGSFTYYCSCGNPVNDSDLCDGYIYNDENQEIKLECFEITEEMVTNIKIVEMSEDVLELDFNGEIRKFEKEK